MHAAAAGCCISSDKQHVPKLALVSAGFQALVSASQCRLAVAMRHTDGQSACVLTRTTCTTTQLNTASSWTDEDLLL